MRFFLIKFQDSYYTYVYKYLFNYTYIFELPPSFRQLHDPGILIFFTEDQTALQSKFSYSPKFLYAIRRTNLALVRLEENVASLCSIGVRYTCIYVRLCMRDTSGNVFLSLDCTNNIERTSNNIKKGLSNVIDFPRRSRTWSVLRRILSFLPGRRREKRSNVVMQKWEIMQSIRGIWRGRWLNKDWRAWSKRSNRYRARARKKREKEREREREASRKQKEEEAGRDRGLFFRTAGYSARNSDAAFAPGAGLNYRAGEVGLRGSKRIKS